MIQIDLRPDMTVHPGHQNLVLPYTPEGCALATLLTGAQYRDLVKFSSGVTLIIPHNEIVDENIVRLIDALAHVRYQAPALVQLTMIEAEAETPQ